MRQLRAILNFMIDERRETKEIYTIDKSQVTPTIARSIRSILCQMLA